MIKIRPQMQGEGTWGYRNSQIFQRGKASPFDPCCHCVDVAGFLSWGIRARQLVIFLNNSPCSSDSCAFYLMLKASCSLASVSNIYILTLAGAHPKCGSWRHPPKARPKKWRRHRGEKLQLSIFLYFFTRNPIFDLRKCVPVSKCSKITIKLFVFSKSKTKFLTYFLFVSLRVFKVSFFQLSQIWCFQSSYFS